MNDIVVVLGVGVPLGIILAILHRRYFGQKIELQEINSSYENIKVPNKKFRTNQTPSSWDGESDLLLCKNCGCLNENYSHYCRKCTGSLTTSESLDSQKIGKQEDKNSH